MVRKKGCMKVKETPNMRGGKGIIYAENLLNKSDTDPSGDEFYGKGRLYSKMTVKPGDSVGYHVHENEMESYYFLQGTCLYNDNGAKIQLSAGDLTWTGHGQGHGLENNGTEDLVFIALILYQ